MVRTLLIINLLLLVGCSDDSLLSKKEIAKKQSINFCHCHGGEVQLIETGYHWSVWCNNGASSKDISYGTEYSCK